MCNSYTQQQNSKQPLAVKSLMGFMFSLNTVIQRFQKVHNNLSDQSLEPTHKGGNWHSKYVTQVQQQRPESPTVTLTWQACKHKVHKLHLYHYLFTGTYDDTFDIFQLFASFAKSLLTAVTNT